MHAIDALEKLASVIRHDNAERGFEAPSPANIATKILLVVSELCEAQNELRDGHGVTEIYYDWDSSLVKKPEGFPIEIADAIIRILDIQYAMDMRIQLINGIDAPVTDIDNTLIYVVHVISRGANEYEFNVVLTILFQLLKNLGLDPAAIIDQKLAYNKTRPFKHGRTF